MAGDKFFWGAATSSHQVEGNTKNDWSEWEKSPVRLAELKKRNVDASDFISGAACDHYSRFKEDFDIARVLGHNAHRFSLEWSRIEPEEGKFNTEAIEHYRTVIKALRERGIEPFVTLWHWTIPLWLRDKGGVVSPTFPDYFRRYAKTVSVALGGDVQFWITVNEPEIYTLNSYLRGKWPPRKKNFLSYLRVMNNLIKAHSLAAIELEKREHAHIGLSVNCSYFESAGGLINDLLVVVAKKMWNYYFLDRVCHSVDFIGLNYYFHNRVDYGLNKNKNDAVSDLGWEIHAEGMHQVLKDLSVRYKKPIIITENGTADSADAFRGKFIEEHIRAMMMARSEGVDVRGYLHWSLLDNFEWDSGFGPRFGLVEVDHRTLERKIRPSALLYKEIIEGKP